MAVIFQPEKRLAAARYSNLLPTSAQRRYASAYICWLRNGAVGPEPERGRLTRAAASTVKTQIDAMNLWVGATIVGY